MAIRDFTPIKQVISIPFLSGSNKAQIRTAKIDKEITEANVQFKQKRSTIQIYSS